MPLIAAGVASVAGYLRNQLKDVPVSFAHCREALENLTADVVNGMASSNAYLYFGAVCLNDVLYLPPGASTSR